MKTLGIRIFNFRYIVSDKWLPVVDGNNQWERSIVSRISLRVGGGGGATSVSIIEQLNFAFQMKTLDEVSAIPAPYPYDYIPADNVKRQRPDS